MKQDWYCRWMNWRWHPANVLARAKRRLHLLDGTPDV